MIEKRYDVELRPTWVDDAIRRKIDIGKIIRRKKGVQGKVLLSCTNEQRIRIARQAEIDKELGNWETDRAFLTAARGVIKKMQSYGVMPDRKTCPTCGQSIIDEQETT